MAKYTLICDEFYDKSKITFEFDCNNINTLLPLIENFIRASGFSYMKGNLDFVISEDNENYQKEKCCGGGCAGCENDSNITIEKSLLFDGNEQVNFGEESPFCEICGLSKSIMKDYDCFDQKCQKGTW